MVYKKKIKVAILLDKTNPWLTNYLSFKYLKLNKRFYYFKFFFNSLEIKNYDIVFILGYTKILPEKFLKKNKLNLIIHESKLPQNRGFSPVQWLIQAHSFVLFRQDSRWQVEVCIVFLQ